MEEDRGGEAVRPNREAAASLLSQALMKAFLYSVNEIEEEEGEEMEERKDIFREKHIYKSRTTDLKSKMVIKAYSPVAYTSLRQMFGFSASDYVSSWKETLIENESSSLQKGLSGKSGSLFLFSKDQRFILKTLPVAESQALRRLLPSYHQHMRENPRSLLARMLGHYRLAFSGGGGGGGRASPLHVVIQHNIFSTASLRLDFVFDLKGATRKRKATEEEKKKPRHVLKDVDFVESGRVFHVGEQLKQVLFEEMEKDCKVCFTSFRSLWLPLLKTLLRNFYSYWSQQVLWITVYWWASIRFKQMKQMTTKMLHLSQRGRKRKRIRSCTTKLQKS
ncbi:Phosphatidylinositol 4-phosphate 5-kinase type-1 alpha-like, variant 2 [Balamuthia mandrillaris]